MTPLLFGMPFFKCFRVFSIVFASFPPLVAPMTVAMPFYSAFCILIFNIK